MQFSKTKNLQTMGVLTLILAGLFLKTIIPAGFMPGFQNGFMTLVICSGMGEKTIQVPVENSGEEEHSAKPDHCAYQIFASYKFIDVPVAVMHQTAVVTFRHLWIDESAVHRFTRISLTARGPPSSLV
jgi:hypothetical protein